MYIGQQQTQQKEKKCPTAPSKCGCNSLDKSMFKFQTTEVVSGCDLSESIARSLINSFGGNHEVA